jgi:ammonia channel protein AmtB
MQPRRAVVIGVIFLFIAAVYWFVPYATGGIIDYAGITMLIALSAAMSIMAYVLLAGSRQG